MFGNKQFIPQKYQTAFLFQDGIHIKCRIKVDLSSAPFCVAALILN